MNGYGAQSLPLTWDSARDDSFFRVVVGVFAAGWLFGASVLLASYDDDASVAEAAVVPAQRTTSTTRSAAQTTPAR